MKRNYIYEEWKDIKGYEGLYQVSNLGRVKALPRNNILAPTINNRGYLKVRLSKQNKKATKYVHRLVAFAFPEICGEWFEGCEINHKDENKLNNIATNLEICTHSYNSSYGKKVKQVIQSDLQGNIIKKWNSIMEIERTIGIDKSSISKCCNGKIKSSHKFLWTFF